MKQSVEAPLPTRIPGETVSVFVSQENAKTEEEAQALLDAADQIEGRFLGGRIIRPTRGPKKVFVVQAYYADDGGKPPAGMARMRIPADAPAEYGIEAE